MYDQESQQVEQQIDKLTTIIDLISQATAGIALTTVVADEYGAAVLHIDGSNEDQLVITITNQTSDTIDVAQLSGHASSSNCNIAFTLPNNTFYFYTLPTIDKANSTPGKWELATDAADSWIGNIYLANTDTCVLQPNGQTGDTLTLVINYGGAVPDDPKVVNVPVIIEYKNMTTGSGIPVVGSSPSKTLQLMADEGQPLPLLGAFTGVRTILNDGSSKQSLMLHLVNTSADPIQFIVPPSGQPTQSYIEVAFPVSDKTTDQSWNLCDTGAWALVQACLSGSEGTGWTVTADPSRTGALKLTPNYPTVTGIPAGGTLDLLLSGVTSSYAPGFVQVQVALKRFAVYGTQSFGVMLEKSPLAYNSTAGSGMTLSAGMLGTNNGLAISGDSSTGLVHLQQSGSGHALLVDGGDVTINNELVVTGNSSSPLAQITQNGTGQALIVNGAAEMTNTLLVEGNVTLNNALAVGGSATVNNALVVEGTATIKNVVQAQGGIVATTNTPIANPPSYPLFVTPDGPGSGLAIGWNQSGGMGETDFYNYGQLGAGGFAFYNSASPGSDYPTNSNLVLLIDSAGNTTVEGNLQVKGNLQVMGQPQQITPGQYPNPNSFQALTDGFAICQIMFPPNNASAGCICWGSGYVNGMYMMCTGGNVGFFGPSWDDWMASNPNSFIMPVSAGSTFSMTIEQMPGDGQQADAPYNCFWVPLGKSTVGDTVVQVDKADPNYKMPASPLSDITERSKKKQDSSKQFVEALENAFNTKLDQNQKQQLADLLQKI